MKIALVIHGNLRTFLMPIREKISKRVCDVLLEKIIKPNNPDVFIETDSNDFYYNNSVNYSNNKIEIVNQNSFRIFENINFLTHEEACVIITENINKNIPNIKHLNISEPYDAASDQKYDLLCSSNMEGSSPVMLIQQYKKLKKLANAIIDYENNNNFKYDVIIKVRFDSMYTAGSLDIKNYDINKNILFVPGTKANLVYDWYAFGDRETMMEYLNLYDKLGFTINDPEWINECGKCGSSGHKGKKPLSNNCIKCGSSGVFQGDITLSSEHHIFKYFTNKHTLIKNAGHHVFIYRYADINTKNSVDDILYKNKDKLKNGTYINHTTKPNEIYIKKI